MDFFIPFLLLSFWVNFSLPFRSRLLGMFFFHASSVPKLWNGIFHSLSHLRNSKSQSLSALLGFVAYPSFSLFLHMHFEVSPIYWTPAMDLWRWLFVIFCPSIYIDTDACILYYFVLVLTYFWVPPYIEEANNRTSEWLYNVHGILPFYNKQTMDLWRWLYDVVFCPSIYIDFPFTVE